MSGMEVTGDRCYVIPAADPFQGKQGLTYFNGISKESTGSQHICMHVLTMPPGARANAHYHEGHESAIYLISGNAEQLWGDRLQNHDQISPGTHVYIPAGVPHVVWNPSESENAVAVIARTDPNEQESVILTPELEAVVQEFFAQRAKG